MAFDLIDILKMLAARRPIFHSEAGLPKTPGSS
jgi:hypothetical protein